MKNALQISDTLLLPLDAATQTFAFIARKGAGKTYAAGKLTELLLDAGVQVVVLDTVGNWYGLRIAADGKGKGFDVPVFGGLRGDLPLQATSGELVADVAVDSGRSLILDLSQFSLGDRKRFAVTFGERLWRKKKAEAHPSPLFLVIEEAQLIVPQQVSGGGDTARMVGIYEEIIRLGRNYGIGCAMISQRPQSVNKEVLNQTECLFVLQVNGAQERKALREWITHQGMDPALLDELPSLPIGTAYVWSPQWLGKLEKVKIAKKKTFDASATPRVGDKTVRREIAPLDLSEIEKQMAATVEAAKANDPRELRKELATARKAIDVLMQDVERAHQGAKIAKVETKPVEVPVLKDADFKHLVKLLDRWEQMQGKHYAETSRQLQPLVDTMKAVDHALGKLHPNGESSIPARAAFPPALPDRGPLLTGEPTRPARIAGPRTLSDDRAALDTNITAPRQRILDALVSLMALGLRDVDKSNAAVFADQSPTSSGFTNNLGALRTAGLIHYPQTGRVALTDAGLAAAHSDGAIRTREDLHHAWFSKLPAPKVRILEQLIRIYPDAIEKAPLAELAHQSPTSSGFTNNLGNLRSLGLIDYPQTGRVVATELLFPPNL